MFKVRKTLPPAKVSRMKSIEYRSPACVGNASGTRSTCARERRRRLRSFRPEAAHQAVSEVARPVPYDIDMLIRTGGELRLSDFLPLQLQYAELFFLKKLFPDITGDGIEGAIGEYYSRERRFGR